MERIDVIWERAAKLHLAGHLQEALQLYDKLLVYTPDDPRLLAAAGSGMSQVQAFGVAIQLLRRAVELKPKFKDAWHNLGISYRTMGLIEEAVRCYETELACPDVSQTDAAVIYANWCGCYVNEGAPERCIEIADQGLRYDSTLPQILNHKALALLELGRYREGLELYEHRVRVPEFTRRDYGKVPRWQGHRVGRLAIHGEQGLGDEILFLSQVHKAIALADEVAIECAQRLLGLLRHSFRDEPKVKLFPTHDELIAAFQPDAWVPMGSLMLATWPIEPRPFLTPSRSYFRTERKRVGVSWRGGTLRTHEYHRNAPFELWRPLIDRLKAHDIDVISVQYGPAAEMAKELGIPHDEQNIADLDTLAAMLRSCDAVLSVCNTTAHMCGALDVPCTVLVPAKPAWRYGLKGERSDWYRSVSYLRQEQGEDWGPVMARAMKWAGGLFHDDYRHLSGATTASA